jgi:Na+/melibiose symporter-like transporter
MIIRILILYFQISKEIQRNDEEEEEEEEKEEIIEEIEVKRQIRKKFVKMIMDGFTVVQINIAITNYYNKEKMFIGYLWVHFNIHNFNHILIDWFLDYLMDLEDEMENPKDLLVM